MHNAAVLQPPSLVLLSPSHWCVCLSYTCTEGHFTLNKKSRSGKVCTWMKFTITICINHPTQPDYNFFPNDLIRICIFNLHVYMKHFYSQYFCFHVNISVLLATYPFITPITSFPQTFLNLKSLEFWSDLLSRFSSVYIYLDKWLMGQQSVVLPTKSLV